MGDPGGGRRAMGQGPRKAATHHHLVSGPRSFGSAGRNLEMSMGHVNVVRHPCLVHTVLCGLVCVGARLCVLASACWFVRLVAM